MTQTEKQAAEIKAAKKAQLAHKKKPSYAEQLKAIQTKEVEWSNQPNLVKLVNPAEKKATTETTVKATAQTAQESIDAAKQRQADAAKKVVHTHEHEHVTKKM